MYYKKEDVVYMNAQTKAKLTRARINDIVDGEKV